MKRSQVIKLKKDNTRLFPIYKTISVDLIFYYSIMLIFLTQVKGLSASDVVLGSAFYGIFNVVLQIPIMILTDKLGNKKSMIVGNIFNSISIMFILVCSNLGILIVAQLFSAVAFSLKNISESSLLSDSIPASKKKGNLIAKIDGAGLANYYYINAASSVLAGYIFGVNGYIPIILCAIITIVSIILSFRFKEIKVENNEQVEEKQNTKSYFKDLKQALKFILKSKRLKGLIMFSGLFYGIHSLLSSYEINLLDEINISTRDIGVAFAVLGIIAGIAANKQNIIHDKLKNKTLTFIGLGYMICCIASGFFATFNYSIIILGFILISYAVRYANNGLFNVSIKRYLGNFTTSKISSKIYSVNYLFQNLLRAIIGIFGSWLLTFTVTTDYAMIIIGCIGTLAMICVTGYMKKRVGLKAEEYKKEDIEFNYIEDIGEDK